MPDSDKYCQLLDKIPTSVLNLQLVNTKTSVLNLKLLKTQTSVLNLKLVKSQNVRAKLTANNNDILYSSQREIKAVVRSHTKS